MFGMKTTAVLEAATGFALTLSLVVSLGLVVGCAEETTAEDDFLAAKAEVEAGDLNAAVVHLKNAAQKSPDRMDVRRALGDVYLEIGLGVAAESQFLRVTRSESHTSADTAKLAHSLILQTKFDEALAALPEDAATVAELVRKGQALGGLEQWDAATAAYNEVLAKEPKSLDAYKGKAWLAWATGNQEQLTEYVASALELSPEDAEAWLLKGMLAEVRGDTAEALLAYDTGLENVRFAQSRYALELHLGASRVLLDENRPENAESHIKAIAATHRASFFYKFLNARLLFQQGDFESARAQLISVLELDPQHGRALLLAGVTERQLGNLNQAAEYLERGFVVQPNSLQIRQQLAMLYVTLDKPELAIEVLEPAAQALPDQAHTWMILASAYTKSGDLQRANEALARASELDYDSADVRSQLAAEYVAIGMNDAALTELDKAVAAEPDNFRAAYVRAVTLLSKGEFQAAIDEAQQLFTKHPENAAPLNLIGAAHFQMGDKESAARMFERAAKLDPAYVKPIVNLVGLDLSEGRFEEAEQRYEKFLVLQPDNATALIGLAQLLMAQDRADEALPRLQQARSGNTHNVESRILLADLQRRQGNPAEALTVVNEALSIQPKNPSALLIQSRAQLDLGQLGDASKSVKKLLKLQPKSVAGLYQLAIVNTRQGHQGDALAALKQLLEVQPENQDAKLSLANLELAMGIPTGDPFADNVSNPVPPEPGSADSVIRIRQLLGAGKIDEALALAQRDVEESPGSVNALVTLGGVHRAKGDFAAAKATFEKILKADPTSATAEVNLAALALQQGEPEVARKHYRDVLAREPSHLQANLGLAVISDDERAAELLRRAMSANPDTVEPILMLAQLYLQRGEIDQANTIAEDGLKKDPSNLPLLYFAGTGQLTAGDLGKAESYAARLVKLGPKAPESWLLRGQIRRARKNFDGGRDDLQQAQKLQPQNPQIAFMRAALEIDAGAYEKAIGILEGLLAQNPKNPEVWAYLGDANWLRGEQSKAIENYIEANDLGRSVKYALKLAQAKWQIGDESGAKALLQKLLDSEPGDAKVHGVLGDMLLAEEAWAAAALEYEAVLKRMPQNAAVMHKLALAYENGGDERASKTLASAYGLDDTNVEILDSYGFMLIRQNQFEQAVTVLQKAVNLENQAETNSARARTRFRLAVAYQGAGNNAAAIDELEAALAFNASFEDKERAERLLAALK